MCLVRIACQGGVSRSALSQRSSATVPLPEGDGPKPSEQQTWTSDQRHALTRQVDWQAHNAIEADMTLTADTAPFDKQREGYEAPKAARDRSLVAGPLTNVASSRA
jgi:hypothetical protein